MGMVTKLELTPCVIVLLRRDETSEGDNNVAAKRCLNDTCHSLLVR